MALMPILRLPQYRFLSLQYGNDGPYLSKFNAAHQLNIMHDANVDPLADMDLWLTQVNQCDAIISIANTTIHGAAGLGKPTFCLLSNSSDWRWLDPSLNQKASYWYSKVTIGYQGQSGSWSTAVAEAQQWLLMSF